MSPRPYDLLLWGATGFTGQVTAEHLAKVYPPSSGVIRWAIGGRNPTKLEKIKAELVQIDPSCKDVDILVADISNQDEVETIVKKTKVVVSTAGPFALVGTPIVDACVRLGTHYCDITGETPWVHELVMKYDEEARKKGVFVVPFCGFDSIPSDMGAFMMVDHIKKDLGTDCQRVEYFLTGIKDGGGMAGGTFRTVFSSMDKPASEAKKTFDPYLLSPPNSPRPRVTSDFVLAKYRPDLKRWIGFFFMAPVNTRVVRRSAALNQYHPSFTYNEYMAFPGLLRALFTSFAIFFALAVVQIPFVRRFLNSRLPESGQGPDKIACSKASFKGVYVAQTIPDPKDNSVKKIYGKIKCPGHPGYHATARMLCEATICLATQTDEIRASGKQGGVLTPASSMGGLLLERLRRAGIVLEVGPINPRD